MRCFIAVDLDEKLKEKVINMQKPLNVPDVKLVEPKNLHFTLKFLGEIDENVKEQVSKRLKEMAESSRPFTVLISGVGAFPNEKFIRVVWIGADNEDKDFLKLHKTVDDSLSGMFKKERPVPHLTLARVGYIKDKSEIESFITHNRGVVIGEMNVDRIKLKKSTLTRNGPIYENLEEFMLR